AAYPSQRDDLDISSVKVFGNTVTVNSTNHGLSAGDQILVENAEGMVTLPTIHPATSGYTDASTVSHWFELNSYPIPPTMNGGLVSLGNKALIVGGLYYNDVTEIMFASGDCALLQFTGNSTLSDGSVKYAYSQSAVASMSTPRIFVTANAFANNTKVLVAGGINDSYINESSFLSSTEIYDLASNTWSSGPALPSVMVQHTQTLLNNGKVLIVGGASAANKARAECQLFDPVSNTITSTGSMSVPRVNHKSVKLNDGKVLVIGGKPLGRESFLESRTLALWRLDDSGSTAVDAGPNGYTLTASGSTTANVSGKINKCRTFSGGHLANSTTSATAVSALQGQWTVEMWLNRENASGVGTVISFGGATSASNDNRLLDIYVSMTTAGFTCTWENGSGNAVTMSSSANGWFGGWCNLAVIKKQNSTNPSTYDLFVYVNGVLRSTFLAQANCSGGNNGYWYIGKSSKAGTAFAGKIDDVRVSSYAKSEGEILQNFRRGCGSIAYPFWGSYGECLASCEIYDPSTGVWTPTGSMSDARSEHTATLLPDGKVLVTGGIGYSAAGTIYASQNLGGVNTLELKTCEIYDPASGTWSPAGSMSVSKWGHSAEYISSTNQVIVPFQGGSSRQSDIFDVKTRKWKRSIDLPNDNWVYNYNSNSVVLDNGLMFITGGPDWEFEPTPQWMYIPAKDFISSENINGLQTVLSATTNEFTYQTDSISANQNYGSDVSIVAAKALSGVNSGPYILTPNQGVAITS
ncbi:hypothetical protein EBZ39_14595, partial [bacterium]|nr:hypothetical protein [bacterium]